MTDSNLKPKEVFPFSEVRAKLGESQTSDYIIKYLSKGHIPELNAQTCVLENEYIDRDFLVDFSKFYARSFDPIDKRTQRLHFFALQFSEQEFDEILKEYNKESIEKLSNSYLGFAVIKPIQDTANNHLIGRTALKTYPKTCAGEGDEREYLKTSQPVSLFGIDLSVESVPFQRQDRAVAACATIACWTTLHSLSKLYNTPLLSPYEITEMSVTFPGLHRNFPSEGLNIYQIKNYYNNLGLESELTDPSLITQKEYYDPKKDDVVADLIKAYVKAEIPVIATLNLSQEKSPETKRFFDRVRSLLGFEITEQLKHAVVITGYRHHNGKLSEIYLHDDQIGPYCKTNPIHDFRKWDNEWLRIFSSVDVEYLFTPLYPKIRLPFKDIYDPYLLAKRDFEADVKKNLRKEPQELGISTELFLIGLNKYKNELLSSSFNRKSEILTKLFPRFVWISRTQFLGVPIKDEVFDATKPYKKEDHIAFETINYSQEYIIEKIKNKVMP